MPSILVMRALETGELVASPIAYPEGLHSILQRVEAILIVSDFCYNMELTRVP
jgi:hypothetical protein